MVLLVRILLASRPCAAFGRHSECDGHSVKEFRCCLALHSHCASRGLASIMCLLYLYVDANLSTGRVPKDSSMFGYT
eukprot:2787275-Pleurochrysis_carterae.AAC.2